MSPVARRCTPAHVVARIRAFEFDAVARAAQIAPAALLEIEE